MENITVLISSFLGRGQRWRLVALVALFFVAGCTVELYPPAQEVNNLPDGGKVDVLPDTIPRAFAFGPRIYWSQIIGSDSSYSIAVTDANNKGRWLDSLRWVPSGPFVTVNGDTLSTRAYARDNSGVTGDNQVLTYNGSGSLTIESGNTVDMSDLLDNTDAQTIDTFLLSGNILSLSIESDGEAAKTVDLSGYLDNTDAQTIDTLTLQGDTMLQVSLSGDGAPVKELDLSALRSIVDSTRLTQDSILVYYQDGAEVGRDTITGGGVTGTGTNNTLAKWTGSTSLGNSLITDDGTNITLLGGLIPQSWTTAARPVGVTSLFGYNTTLNRYEGYYNAEWNSLASTLADISANSTTTAKSLYTMTSGQDVEFRRPGSNTLLYLKGSNGYIGIGTNAPTYPVHIIGNEVRIQNSIFQAIGGDQYLQTTGGNFWYRNTQTNKDLLMFVNNSVTGYGTGLRFYGSTNSTSFVNSGISSIWVNSSNNVGIGVTSPTAAMHLKAGTATANTAPLKFTSGTNLTTPEAGAVEWDGTNLYITQTTGPTRKTIAYVDTDDGSASDTTDGSGDITVSHSLGSASITVTATATGTTFYHVQVHTKTSTTFKIRFFDAAGAAVTATAVTADWIAKLQ